MHSLTHGNSTRYVIQTAQQAPSAVRHAAAELQEFIGAMTGAELGVIDDSAPLREHAILIGKSRHLQQLCPEDLGEPKPDGYRLRSFGPHLAIWGPEPRGTLYGVYALLHQLGCRWFTRDVSVIPRRERIEFPPQDERYSPPLDYRNFMLWGVMSPNWCARNHVNGLSSEVGPEHGGKMRHWQFGHSFDSLVPPDRYYDEHPEYFALIDGKRLREETQLCCTHPGAVRLVTDNLRSQIERDLAAESPGHPSPEFYYLAQNDWGNCCECASCQALVEREESHAAPVLHLCNEVVEELTPEFPDKSFLTISYRFSAKPPKRLTAHPELIVQVCPIECCVAHPFDMCDFSENVRFREYMEGWSRTASRLWVWDYATDLRNPLVPTPGLPPLAENLRWFIRHGVSGYFYQDVGLRQFNELRGWLISRLLWRPDDDPASLAAEFLEAFYGPAAGPIQDYIGLLHREMECSNVHTFYSDTPAPAYLTDAVLRQSRELWDDAEDAVRTDPVFLSRVRKERGHNRLARVERESRAAVVHHCRLEGGRHSVTKPGTLKQESREVQKWAKAAGADRLGLLSCEQFEQLIESETVTFDNGLLRLTFAPRLGPRVLNLELLGRGDTRAEGSDARSLFVLEDSDHPEFPSGTGYHERWLAAPGAPDPVTRSPVGWAEGSLGLSSYAYYTKPMYHWWHANLEEDRAVLAVGVRVLNRSNGEQDAAIECVWPLHLGARQEVEIFIPRTGTSFPASEPLEISGEDISDGLSLRNASEGLAVNFRLESGGWRSLLTSPHGAEGVRVSLRTRSELIIPAAWRTHLHKLGVESTYAPTSEN